MMLLIWQKTLKSGQMEAIDDTLHFEFDRDFTMHTNTNKGIKQ